MATKRTSSDLSWTEVSVETPALAKRLLAVREAEKRFRDEKAAFETQFVAAARKAGAIDEGYTLAFGYRFGKLSVAKVAEASEKTPRASNKPVFKL